MTLRLAVRRLLLLALLFTTVWLSTAAIAHYLFDAFPNYGEAIWSGLQHLLDPGAIEEDRTFGERAIGVLQLLFGLVFIVGVLLAVLEEAVSGSLRRIAEGEPRIRSSGQIAIIGWNPLVPELVAQIAADPQHPKRMVVAVLLPGRLREQRVEIAADLERRGRSLKVPVLSGDAGEASFDRLNVRTAQAVVVASGAEDPSDPDAADLETISSCLALRGYLDDGPGPAVYPMLRRGRNVDAIVDQLPSEWDYVVADRAVGGLVGAAVSRPELTAMAIGQLTDRADRGMFYVVAAGELAGRRFEELAGAHSEGLPVGVVPAGGEPQFAPDPDTILDREDSVIVAAPSRAEAETRTATTPLPAPVELRASERTRAEQRVLAIGGPPAVAELLEDLGERAPQRFTLTLLTRQAASVRREPPANVTVDEVGGSEREPRDVARALERSRPDVAFVGTDVARDGEAADPRALLTAFRVRKLGGAALPLIVSLMSRPGEEIGRRDPNMHVASTSVLLASWIAMVLAEPVSAAVSSTLLEGRLARFETLTIEIAGPGPTTFAALYRSLLRQASVPFGRVRADGAGVELGLGPEAPIASGDLLVVIRRRDRGGAHDSS